MSFDPPYRNVPVELIDSDSDSELDSEPPFQREVSDGLRLRSSAKADSPNAQLNKLSKPPSEKDPASIFKEDSAILRIKQDYRLPESMILRPPLAIERANQAGPDEITVYENFFVCGMREAIPALVGEAAAFLGVSPSQFIPSVWSTLIAIQVFREAFSIPVGIQEVLYSYKFKNSHVDESRYRMHIRKALVFGTIAYDREWKKKYVFMKIGSNTNFPIAWKQLAVDTERCEAGAVGVAKVTEELIRYRSVEFLTSDFALSCSTIWGCNTMKDHPRSGVGAFELFKKVNETKKAGTTQLPLLGPAPEGDALRTKDSFNEKRKTFNNTSAPSIPKRAKASQKGDAAVLSSSHHEMTILANPSPVDSEFLSSLCVNDIIDQLQSNLHKSVHMCNFLKATSSSNAEELKRERELVTSLSHELSLEKTRATAAELASVNKDGEISCLEKQILDLKAVARDSQERSASLEKKNVALEAENATLKCEIASLKDEINYTASGAMIIARWELLREWDNGNGKIDHWNLRDAEEQYQYVTDADARFKLMSMSTLNGPAGTAINSEDITIEPAASESVTAELATAPAVSTS